jgi:hypothetical protein
MNYQDIKVLAFRLSVSEQSWHNGTEEQRFFVVDLHRLFRRVQALIWDFCNCFPGKETINRSSTDAICSATQRRVALNLSNLPGKYAMKPMVATASMTYATYKDLGAPAQLQGSGLQIKSENSGAPVDGRTVEIGSDGNLHGSSISVKTMPC